MLLTQTYSIEKTDIDPYNIAKKYDMVIHAFKAK